LKEIFVQFIGASTLKLYRQNYRNKFKKFVDLFEKVEVSELTSQETIELLIYERLFFGK